VQLLRAQLKSNGTTTVRLFNPSTKEFEFVTVETAVIIDKNRSTTHEHHAAWVYILKQAFCAMHARSYDKTQARHVKLDLRAASSAVPNA